MRCNKILKARWVYKEVERTLKIYPPSERYLSLLRYLDIERRMGEIREWCAKFVSPFYGDCPKKVIEAFVRLYEIDITSPGECEKNPKWKEDICYQSRIRYLRETYK